MLEVDIHTTVPAEVELLHIVGTVVELDGGAAGAGLPVTIRLDMADGSHVSLHDLYRGRWQL